MITIYYAYYGTKLEALVYSRYLNLLPNHITEGIERYRKWEDSQASLMGKLLLRKGLEELGLNFSLKDLKYNKYGRPYIEGGLDFNISHSGDYALCAISSTNKVGVDLQEIKPISISDFKGQFLEEEWEIINCSEDKCKKFYHYWTAKEAAIKAAGKGLSIHLKEVRIMGDKVSVEGELWGLKTLQFHKDYILQVVSDKDIQNKVRLIQVFF